MALSSASLPYLRDTLTKDSAGDEFAAALNAGLKLSPDTLYRLGIAMTSFDVAANIQAAILGQRILSKSDLERLIEGFGSAAVANEILILTNVANLVPPPASQGMPSSFSLVVSRDAGTQAQTAVLSMPAGSTFASTGVAGYIQVQNAGNANTFVIWYNVAGGSNTAPSVPGATLVQVNISASDSAATIAAETYAATSALPGMTATVSTNVVNLVANAILAAIPTFSIAAGSYTGGQSVALSSLTPGAIIYYTTDGSTPTIASSVYSAPISVAVSETIKSMSVKAGFGNSPIASAAYVISGAITVATPTFSPAAGTYAGTQSVTVSSLTAGSTFYYTLDGSTPTTGSTLYSGPVSVNASQTLKVLAVHAGDINSAIGSAAYVITALGPAAVNLASAAFYRILSEAGISTTAGSAITGNIGVSPIAHTAITGFTYTPNLAGAFGSAPEVSGGIYTPDNASPTPSNVGTAISDMQAAYTDAAGRITPDHTNLGSGNIGGLSLTPGLYKWTTGVTIPTNVTLNGGPSDVYIMQVSGTLNITAAKSIILAGGLLPQNIFWQVTGAVTLGVSSVFEGIVLGATSIAVQTTATVHGALFAQTAVTLDDDVISA